MKTVFNQYYKDAALFFRSCTKNIYGEMNDFPTIQQTLSLALGMERLMKAILYDINPTYILIDPTFKNSVKLFYKGQLLPTMLETAEVAKIPNGDVLTFRNSLLRCTHFSATALKYKNILFKLSDARDIIVHNELTFLDLNELKTLLKRDCYTVIKSFTEEIDVKPSYFLGSNHIRLAKLSSDLQDNLEDKVSLILETHRATWKAAKVNSGYESSKQATTAKLIETQFKEGVICPACEHTAVLYLRPIFDTRGLASSNVLVAYKIIKVSCQFCKLEIRDAATLDLLNMQAPAVDSAEKCAHCSAVLPSDNSTGLCANCDEFYGTEN